MRLLSDLSEEEKKSIQETPWDIVIHHGGCPDGVTAAWVVLRSLDWKPHFYGSEPEVVPYDLWEKLDHNCNLNIIVVDLSFSKEDCDEIHSKCNKFLIVDHHQTAARNLSDCDYFIYGGPKNTLSGAGMVKQIYGLDEEKFKFVNYVSDRDTWQNVLPETKGINLAMAVEDVFDSPKTVEHFYCTQIVPEPEECLNKLAEKGNIYLEYQKRLIGDLLYRMKVVNFHYSNKDKNGDQEDLCFPIAILNSSVIQSDVANYILRHQEEIQQLGDENFPSFKFAIVYTFSDPTVNDGCGFSIRCEDLYTIEGISTQIGADDIAGLFGGGGHAKAAGFYCSAREFFSRTSELENNGTKTRTQIQAVGHKQELNLTRMKSILKFIILSLAFAYMSTLIWNNAVI